MMNSKCLLRFILAMSWLAAASSSSAQKPIISSDAKILAIPTDSEYVDVVATIGGLLARIQLDSPAVELAFSPDNQRLAACLSMGGVVVLDIPSKTIKKTGDAGKSCKAVFWTPKGEIIYVLGLHDVQQPMDSGLTVMFWDFAGGDAKTLHTRNFQLPPPPATPPIEPQKVIVPGGPARR